MKLKPLAAALGMSLAVASFTASAAITWGTATNDYLTLFEDNNIDFHIDLNDDGILDAGESLIAVFEVETSNGVDIAPQELTGIAWITLLTIADLDGVGGDNDFVFAPNADFNNTYLGGLYDGAMVAMWLDDEPELGISAGLVTAGTTTCDTFAECVAQATDGELWEVDGFSGDDDEFWVALNAQANTDVVLEGPIATEFGAINAGLSILYNGTGQNLALNSISCVINEGQVDELDLCGTGGDGFVDMLVGGSVKGGGGNNDNQGLYLNGDLVADDAVATSDFDFQKRVAVPEPASLALLGIGLMGLGAMRRTRKS